MGLAVSHGLSSDAGPTGEMGADDERLAEINQAVPMVSPALDLA